MTRLNSESDTITQKMKEARAKGDTGKGHGYIPLIKDLLWGDSDPSTLLSSTEQSVENTAAGVMATIEAKVAALQEATKIYEANMSPDQKFNEAKAKLDAYKNLLSPETYSRA